MRQVKITHIHLENFKGLRNVELSFDDSETRICGANGVGKTTLFDAYLWLLTGSDSSGSSSFFVQPLDKDGNTIPHIITSVCCSLIIDGSKHDLKRTFEQKWSRKRGSNEDIMNGNVSNYFIDGVPFKLKEFNAWIEDSICGKDNFSLLSSVSAFGKLEVKEKRSKLMEMAGQLPSIMNATDYPRLFELCQTGKSVDEVVKSVKFELQGLKEEKSKIPAMLSENERNLPQGIDFNEVKKDIDRKKLEVKHLDDLIQKNSSASSSIFLKAKELRNSLAFVDAELDEIASGVKKERDECERRLSAQKSELLSKSLEVESKVRITESEIETLKVRRDKLQDDLVALTGKWKNKNKNNDVFVDTAISECPTCHRPFNDVEILKMRESLIRSFNDEKKGSLHQIEENYKDVKKECVRLDDNLMQNENNLQSLRDELKSLKSEQSQIIGRIANIPTLEICLSANKEYTNVLKKKEAILSEIESNIQESSSEDDKLNQRKAELNSEIESLISVLSQETMLEKVSDRRHELQEKDRDLAIKIASLDGILYEAQKYSKAKIQMVEDVVSSNFNLVTWKMYEPNVTNDGEREICECLVDGVPVSKNANLASRINAGIDIVNALSEWLGLSVPLWIDGKESVTNLIECKSQLITLEVCANSVLSTV